MVSLFEVRSRAELLISSADNVLQIYKKSNYKDCCDRILGADTPVESMAGFNDEIFIGCENGKIFELSLYPHKMDLLGFHDDDENLSLSKIDVSRCGRILGSIGDDNSVCFKDLQEYRENKLIKKEEKKDLNQNNNKKSKNGKNLDQEFFEDL